MKSIFSSRRNKSPHNNEEADKQGASFFGKDSKTPFFNSSRGGAVQAKLTVGQPGDKYEKEADNMADAVVNNSTSKPEVQNKEISGIQRESLATPQEDEKLGTAEQRMEEDKLVQEKPDIQRMGSEEEDEGMVNKMEGEEEEEGMISKMGGPEEEEETLQTKSNGSATIASSGITQQIKSKSGKGTSLPKNTRAEMEASFGRDFSGVNIHTDQDAVSMNKELGAQAFTHGKDVYFNAGKYNPDSTQGKHLLAHELTHVVQQNKESEILQRYPGPAPMTKRMQRRVDLVLKEMKDSTHTYVVDLGTAIEQGHMDVAVPDFFDTSEHPGDADSCPIDLLEPMSLSSVTYRRAFWEKGKPGFEKRNWTARVPGTNELLPFIKGIKGFTRQLGDYDGTIYLYVETHDELVNTIIHEALHLTNPLVNGSAEDVFISELRSYYYGEYRNEHPEQQRFETAIGDAENASKYLAGAGISMQSAIEQKAMWMKKIGKP